MGKPGKPLEDLVKELPPGLRDEVRDFVEFLQSREQNMALGVPAFSWEGALRDLGSRYTSVDLQHLIARWRVEAPRTTDYEQRTLPGPYTEADKV
jgi:hypothetical protein